MVMKNQNRKAFLANAAPWLLLIMAAIICLWRIRYFYEPLDNDLPIRMAYATRALLGDRYYTDLFVFGPPGSLWVNELFISIFGANYLAVYVMGCVFSVITLIGVYRSVLVLSGKTGALISAATWAVISADLYTQANQPNTEVFINAALVWAFALLLDEKNQKNIWYAITSGLLFFLASTVKHFTLVVPAMAFLALIFASRTEAGKWRPFLYDRETWLPWLVAGGVVTVCWILLFAWYSFTGRFTLLFNALIGDSIHYAAAAHNNHGLAFNFVTGLKPSRLLPWFQLPFLFLYLSLIAGVAINIFKLKEARWFIVTGWFIGTWLSVCFPGKFFSHYYMLWLPIIAIGPGILFDLMDKRPNKFGQTIKLVIVFMVLALAVRQAYKVATIAPVEAVRLKYGELGAIFAETRDLGQKIAHLRSKKISIFEIGVSGLYFYANATPPSRFVDSLYVTMQPDQYVSYMRKYIAANPPELLVVRRSLLTGNTNEGLGLLATEVLRNGAFVEDNELSSKHLVVFRRINGARMREQVTESPGG